MKPSESDGFFISGICDKISSASIALEYIVYPLANSHQPLAVLINFNIQFI